MKSRRRVNSTLNPLAPITGIPSFPTSFVLLQQEGYLIRSCLATGLTELRSAHVQNKGSFYAALFNLSVGTERLLKATIIIDQMLKNKLSVPTRRQLKDYGHDIHGLYNSCVTIASAELRKVQPLTDLDASTCEIVGLLNDFAQTTRYHNLDALSSASSGKNSLAHWNEILLAILRSDVSSRRTKKIVATAAAKASAISDSTTTVMHGFDRQALTTEQALTLLGLHDEAIKYAVLYLMTFLSPIRDLISDLSHKDTRWGFQFLHFRKCRSSLIGSRMIKRTSFARGDGHDVTPILD